MWENSKIAENKKKHETKTYVQDQDTGNANGVEGNKKEKHKTTSNNEMKQNKDLVQFRATGMIKVGIEKNT